MQVWFDLQVTLCDPHLSALEVRFSRRCAIQIDVYLYLYLGLQVLVLVIGPQSPRKLSSWKSCVSGYRHWCEARWPASGVCSREVRRVMCDIIRPSSQHLRHTRQTRSGTCASSWHWLVLPDQTILTGNQFPKPPAAIPTTCIWQR